MMNQPVLNVQFSKTWKANPEELTAVKYFVAEKWGKDEADFVNPDYTFIEKVPKNRILHALDSIYQTLKITLKHGFQNESSSIYMLSKFPSKERADKYLQKELNYADRFSYNEQTEVYQAMRESDGEKVDYARINDTEILVKI